MNNEEAQDLHKQSLVIDGHNDSIVAMIRSGNRNIDGTLKPNWHEHEGAVAYLRQYYADPEQKLLQLDLRKMKKGELDAAFFAVDCTRSWSNHLLYGLDAIGYFMNEVKSNNDSIKIAHNASELIAAKDSGAVSALLAIENSDAFERSPYILPLMYKLGVRSVTLTHSTRSHAADGCEVLNGGGLTYYGHQLIEQMNDLGIIVDISHTNEASFWDTLEKSQNPVVGTHNCCRTLCDHPRNLSDKQLRAIAGNGGIVGITFVPSFVSSDIANIDGLLDHIEHAVRVAGIDHVGLGSDFDGGGDLITDVSKLPEITVGLAARGFDEKELKKVLGLNWLRVIQDVVG